jgi:hypothetical protein
MSSISDPQRLVELVAHTMFRDATERDRRRRPPRERKSESEEKEKTEWTSSS